MKEKISNLENFFLSPPPNPQKRSNKGRIFFERRSELGWQKIKVNKKKRYHDNDDDDSTSTTNFVPGQTIHFLVKVFAFLSLFQPPRNFSYVFHFHNLSKRPSEKTIFTTKFLCKKIIKKNYSFFFSIFFLCPKPTRHVFLSILL